MDANLSLIQLQHRVDELRKRLQALENVEEDIDFTEINQKKEAAKEGVLKELHNLVQSEKDANARANILVKFPKSSTLDGAFDLELPGEGITWATIRDRACVMFGRDPAETLIAELKAGGQRVLVPLWTELSPGQLIHAELISKPFVPVRARGLRSRDQSSSRVMSKTQSSGPVQQQPGMQSDDGSNGKNLPSITAVRREKLCELFLQVAIFVVLAVGIIDPTNTTGPARWFEVLLSNLGHSSVVTMRSGLPTTVQFQQNVTSMSEAWDWIEGPLTRFLVTNTTSTAFPSDLPDWWGFTRADVCPLGSGVADLPPLCTTHNFSTPKESRPRWLTSVVATEVIGSVRLRQFRVRPNSCRNSNKNFLINCFEDYNLESRSTLSYGPAECGFEWRSEQELAVDRPGAPPIQGALARYDSSGYVLDVASALYWNSALTYLKENGWVDEATKAIIIEMSVRNPSEDLFASVRAIIEKDKVGTVRTRHDVYAFTVPQNGCPSCEVRFITDIIAFLLVLTTAIRALMGGFFYKARHQMWRTYDLCFAIIFLGSFILDMIMLDDYRQWQDSLNPATAMYRSLDDAHLSFRIANRYRAGIIAMMTLRFLILGSFSLSRLTTMVFAKLMCIYILLGVLLVPFVCSLTILVMVLEQGSPVQVVSFGNALRDIMLIVTGVTDRLTAATPRIGRQSGWSIVFYLFLIAFVWVLIVPTLIAWAIVVYERAVEMRREMEEKKHALVAAEGGGGGGGVRGRRDSTTNFEKTLSTSMASQSNGGRALSRNYTSESEKDPEADKSAVQIIWEGSIEIVAIAWKRVGSWRQRRTIPKNV